MAAKIHLCGNPYAPGWGRGRVVRDPGKVTADSVLVISQVQLGSVHERPAAYVVTGGAPFSHPMIRLLAQGVPVVIVTSAAEATLPEGWEVVVDGATGMIADSDLDLTFPVPMPPAPRPGSPILSADGQSVTLRASVADAQGAAYALRNGASAIGLLRSEFLRPAGGARPDAEFYETALHEVCVAAHPLPVTVRLIDIAADKRPAWLPALPGMQGALGLQGIRLYDHAVVREVLAAELLAVSRLAPAHELSLLLPYVVRFEEFYRWRNEIERVLPVPLAIGSMIETPAAALAVTDLLTQADFVALGCNDLMQCLFATDRDNAELAPLLDPYAPVLYRFLRQIISAAGDDAGRLQVCGLLAQLPGTLPVMLGLGYRVFSVEPALLPYLAQTIALTDVVAAQGLAAAVCAARDSESVHTLMSLPTSATLSPAERRAGRATPAPG